MRLAKIDENGMFLKDVIVDKFPTIEELQTFTDEDGNETEQSVQVNDPLYVATPCRGGLYLPKWDGIEWIEGKTTAEIKVIVTEQLASTDLSMQEQLDLLLD